MPALINAVRNQVIGATFTGATPAVASPLLPPVTLTGGASITPVEIDVSSYEGQIAVCVITGAVTSTATLTALKVQAAPVYGGTYADTTATFTAPTASNSAASLVQVQYLDLNSIGASIKLVGTGGGTGNMPIAAFVVGVKKVQ